MKKPSRRPLSKYALEVRADLAAVENFLASTEVAEFFTWWKLNQPVDSGAILQEYCANLEASGLAPAAIDQRITVLRKYLQPTRPLSKYALEVRAEILAAVESLPEPSEYAGYVAWREQLEAGSGAALQEYRANLEASDMAPAAIDQRITVLRKYVQLWSEPPPVYASYLVPLFQFQAPAPDPLNESFEEWTARISPDHQRAWQRFLDEQGVAWRATLSRKSGSPLLNETIIGDPIAYPKPRRGSGKKGRVSSIADRHKYAAEWLLGRDWVDIAFEYLKPTTGPEVHKATDRVYRSGTEMLHTAGFDKSDRLPAKRK